MTLGHPGWLDRTDRVAWRWWFALAILFAAVGGGLSLAEGFGGEFVVQDDARQHVFWTRRYADPELFPGDAAADYFQSVAPLGYRALYAQAAAFGLDPVAFAKAVPAMLGLLCGLFAFLLAARLTGLPAASFAVSWVVTQNIWILDDVSSATPRAFLYPFLLAFLYFLIRRAWLGVGLSVALLGLFYPQIALVAGGVAGLSLIRFDRGRPSWPDDARLARAGLVGVAVTIAVVGAYAAQNGAYDPVVSRAEAAAMPEFHEGGRATFFRDDAVTYWACGRSGLFPKEWCEARDEYWYGVPALVLPLAVLIGLLSVPFWLRRARTAHGDPVVTADVHILWRLLVVSVGLYAAAHVLLFTLHLPNRYSAHSMRLIADIGMGLGLWWLARRALAAARRRVWSRWPARAGLALIVVLFLGFPVVVDLVGGRVMLNGRFPDLYRFLRETPKDTVVASLTLEASNLPTFGQRGVVAAREHAIPYHLGYYMPFRARMRTLAEAQFSEDPAVLVGGLAGLGADYWLVSNNDLDASRVVRRWWARNLPDAGASAAAALSKGIDLPIHRARRECAVWEHRFLTLVSVDCLRELWDEPSSTPDRG